MAHVVFQLVIGGLAMGAVYALVALGFTLIWNAVGIVNFAQGDVVMLGAYLAVGWCVDTWHLPVGIDLLVMIAFMIVFGWAFAVFVYRPVRNAPQLSAIVATLGLGMVLENSVVLIWGPEAMSSEGPFGNATLHMFGARIYEQYPLILFALVLLMCAQEGMFRFTSIGRAMRATAQDPEAAMQLLQGQSTLR